MQKKGNNIGRWYAIFLALLPIVMAYKFPGVESGFATVMIALGLIPAFFIIIRRLKYVNYAIVFLISMYLGYVITKAEGNSFLLPIAIVIHIASISTGAVNAESLRKYIEKISVIAAICVITQQIVHLFLGFHIPLMAPDLLIDDLKDYSINILTGGAEVESMYRPCAFFLEPAHFSQYVIYGLGSALFRNPSRIKEALIISLGLIATTSGMGFVLTFGIWGWWYLIYYTKGKKIARIRSSIICGIVIVVILFLMMQIPFFAQIIARFTNDGSSEYNAIDGRLIFWGKLFEDQSLSNLIFGYGEVALEDDIYYTGLMKILYAYGIVGTFFFYLFLLYLFFITNKFSKTYVLSYIGLSFLANLTGFIPIIFNIGVILVFDKIKFKNNLQ